MRMGAKLNRTSYNLPDNLTQVLTVIHNDGKVQLIIINFYDVPTIRNQLLTETVLFRLQRNLGIRKKYTNP